MNKPRISRMAGILMIVIAAIIDFAQFILTLIPPVGWFATIILSICATFFFGIGFYHHRINLFGPKMILGTMGTMLAESTPFINGIPWWTARIARIVTSEWSKKSAV